MSDRASAAHHSSWSNKPVASKIVVSLVVAAVVSAVLFVIRNPDFLHRLTGPGFKTGDCATVAASILSGGEMKHADCPTANTGNSITDPVYRVAEVKSGKDAVCPGGFENLTFSNEPENTTYCLTMVGFG